MSSYNEISDCEEVFHHVILNDKVNDILLIVLYLHCTMQQLR